MTRSKQLAAIVALGLAVTTAGCGDFLTGNKLNNNPNNPSAATVQQSFVAVQAGTFGMEESTLPMTFCMWMQQCTGIGGRFVEEYGRYNITEGSHSFDFSSMYTGGGLIDIRRVVEGADALHDSVYLGIGQIYEAIVMGHAADLWGDIPYSEAVSGVTTPALDPQLTVYAELQALLDQAIVNLGGAGPGPQAADLVYGGDPAQWIAAAYTLKARLYMHTAEVDGAAAYNAAIAAAGNGIGSPADDWRTFHTQETSGRNIWFQFSQSTFGQDLVSGKFLVDLLVARSDPRLPVYFAQNSVGGYGGQDVNTPVPDSLVSQILQARGDMEFRQPVLTYVENQLILAEAKAMTGDDPGALVNLNNARATVPLGNLAGITGAALRDSIAVEKYIALFQNIEVFNDYKRTCRPVLAPYPTVKFGNTIPGRLFYGGAEHNANPNIPSEAEQLNTNGFRNANDPNPC